MPAKITIKSISNDTVTLDIEVDGHLEQQDLILTAGYTVDLNLMEEDKIRIINGIFDEKDIKKFGWEIETA